MSQPATRRGFDRQVRYGRLLGLLFAVAGFVTIGFGWNGAAKNALFDKQFPYLISGGLGGLALVVFGVGLLLVAQVRAERAKLAEHLEHLASIIGKAASAVPAEAGTNGRVVAGRSTYHRPDCRLVKGKEDLDLLSVEAARGSGLSPCRVCNPEQVDTETEKRPSRSRGGRR